jgi:GNAT superfamily N-acetyltransferase
MFWLLLWPRGAIGAPEFSSFKKSSGTSLVIDQTVHATRSSSSAQRKNRPFHTFEILSDGAGLGHLNMIYLRKPITSHYLVYVEVLPHFRGKGLGAKILSTFGKFVEASKTIGLLENIILPEEPTYTLYAKHGWRPIEDFIGPETVPKCPLWSIFGVCQDRGSKGKADQAPLQCEKKKRDRRTR